FQWLGDVLSKTVPQHRHESLGSSVDAQTLLPKRKRRAPAQETPRRNLVQKGFADHQRQICVAARNGMADAVALASIEEQHLVGFGNRLIMSNMPHVNAAIGKHEMRIGGVLFVAQMSTTALAIDILDRNGLSLQQRVDREFRHELAGACSD